MKASTNFSSFPVQCVPLLPFFPHAKLNLATLTAKRRILEWVSSVGHCRLSTSPALTLTAEVRSDAFRVSETAVISVNLMNFPNTRP
ncbi:hypothetical protein TIFTF001_021163 [Ficus carica]|uniref:Uncharacterized protein n=1 Tax=Ficus carica TaxID=3494 RepID=A0AA88AH00_FICCA|nr:hypothetical protein TIFTF001_021163 [Ficus carica]